MQPTLITIGTNIVHTPKCRFVAGKKSRWVQTGLLPKDVLAGPYRFCQCCSPVAGKYRVDRKVLDSRAAKSGMSLQLKQGLLHITSKRDSWLIVPSESILGIGVYHKNKQVREGQITMIPGYHRQAFYYYTILDVLDCIDAHDMYKERMQLQAEELKRKREEEARLKQLASAAAADYYKTAKKNKHSNKSTHKPHRSHTKVIKADPTDWESFRALFHPNAAE